MNPPPDAPEPPLTIEEEEAYLEALIRNDPDHSYNPETLRRPNGKPFYLPPFDPGGRV